jgi:hypothetical protein
VRRRGRGAVRRVARGCEQAGVELGVVKSVCHGGVLEQRRGLNGESAFSSTGFWVENGLGWGAGVLVADIGRTCMPTQPTNQPIDRGYVAIQRSYCVQRYAAGEQRHGECRDLYRIIARHVAKAPPGRLSQS